ncbi:DNA-binding protein [Alteromonadaceae bacterium M269]|nr:DNA-binding protein [Alteromonadaceae bacterium M269]
MKDIEKITVRELNQQKVKLEAVGMMIGLQASAVGKLEKKRIGDVSVARLKDYLSAVGGELCIQVKLPSGDVLTV